MEYRKFGDTIVLRLEVGEEIAESLAALCEKEKLELCQVSGLGAALRGTLPEKKESPTCTCIWYSEIPGRMSVWPGT